MFGFGRILQHVIIWIIPKLKWQLRTFNSLLEMSTHQMLLGFAQFVNSQAKSLWKQLECQKLWSINQKNQVMCQKNLTLSFTKTYFVLSTLKCIVPLLVALKVFCELFFDCLLILPNYGIQLTHLIYLQCGDKWNTRSNFHIETLFTYILVAAILMPTSVSQD